jgi:hypothetical protein
LLASCLTATVIRAPRRRAIVIPVGSEHVGARAALLERFLAVALEHQIGGAPDIDLGYHAGKLQSCGRETINTNNCMAWKPACQGGGYMAAILTAEGMSSVELPLSALTSTSAAASAFGLNRPQRSCGSTASNFGHSGVGGGLDRRNRHRCFEWIRFASNFCNA